MMSTARAKEIWPACGALLLGAAALILHKSAHYSLWYDEAWSALAVRNQTLPQVLEAVRQDFHPPLYFLILYFWTLAAGFSEQVFRFPSVLSALVTAAITFRFASSLFRRSLAGAFAVVLLASMPFQIRFAQETRMYAMLEAFMAASMFLFWAYRRKPRRGLAVAYVAATTAALYTQYLALFVVALQIGFAILLWGREKWKEKRARDEDAHGEQESKGLRMVSLSALSLALFLPWLPVFISQLTAPDYFSIHRPALPTSLRTIAETFNQDFFAGLTVVFLALLALAFLRIDRAPRWHLRVEAPPAWGLLGWWAFGWLALAFGSNVLVPNFQPRNALPALPVVALLAARGLTRLPRRAGVVILFVLAAVQLARYDEYQAHDPHYRDAVVEMSRGFQAGDTVFVQTNSFLHELPIRFYFQTLLPPHPQAVWLNALPGQPGTEEFDTAFREAVNSVPRFWLFQTLPVDNAWLTRAIPHVEAGRVQVDAFQISLYTLP